MDHQLRNLGFLMDHPKACDFSEQGTGKTFTAIAAAVSNEECNRVLIVCPIHLIPNWVEALERFDIDPKKIAVLDGGPIVREKSWPKLFEKKSVLITNYAKFRIEEEFFSSIAEQYSLFTIVDEAHEIGNCNSKITQAMLRFSEKVKWMLLLTGTPHANRLDKVYPLFEICDSTKYYSSYDHFMQIHAVTRTIKTGRKKIGRGGREYDEKITIVERWRNHSILSANEAYFSVRVTKEECLDLPDKIFVKRYCAMLPEQEKAYRSLEKMYFAELTDGSVLEVTNALAKATRLRQMSSNPFLVDPAFSHEGLLPKEKILLADLESYADSKVVIFCDFVGTFDRLEKILPEGSFVSVRGGEKNLREKLDRFNEDSECRFFVGIRAACYTGLNLQVANVLINYELDHNYLHYSQATDRTHRNGQLRNVIIVDYIVEDTIDHAIVASLDAKCDNSRRVFDYFIQYKDGNLKRSYEKVETA